MTIMRGAPPPQPAQVTLANWRQSPYNQWAFHHVRELLPSARIACGQRSTELARAPQHLDSLTFSDRHGRQHVLAEALRDTSTDGFIVLKNGMVIDERYANGLKPDSPHIAMSVSKSLTACLAGILIDRGLLAPDAPVVDYLPELSSGAYAKATLRHLLDMRAGVAFDEDYTATEGIMIAYRQASGWNPPQPEVQADDLRSFLSRLQPQGAHGGAFKYVSPNTDLLGWIIERVSGVAFASLLSNELWQPMGAEHDGYVTVDRLGAPRVAGGICVTLRDLARLGQTLCDGGLAGGRVVLPSEWVHDTTTGGDDEAWRQGNFAFLLPHGRYRNQWYQVGDELNAFLAVGIHGQFLYVAPKVNVVIARFASFPIPLDEATETLMVDAFAAIARAVA